MTEFIIKLSDYFGSRLQLYAYGMICARKLTSPCAVSMCTHIYSLLVCARRHLSRLSLCLWLQYQTVKSIAGTIRIKVRLFFPRLFPLSLYLRISFPLKKTCK
jgi:hypothetical protein